MSIVDALQRAKLLGQQKQVSESRLARAPGRPKRQQPEPPRQEADRETAHATTQTLEPTSFPRLEYSLEACAVNRIIVPDNEARLIQAASPPYRMLRTRILQRCRTNQWSRLALTSPGPGEGKSVTAINLALSIAREGNHDVFLIDLDMRNPSTCRYLGVTPPAEVVSYFAGTAEARDIFFTLGIENLTVAGGTTPTNRASELLATTRLEELFDYIGRISANPLVILDLPPVVNTDDALVVAPKIDAIMLVVAEGRTRREGLSRAIELLTDFPLAGIVLNRTSESVGSEYYGGNY